MMQRLKRRADFLKATARGRRFATPGLVLQMVARADDPAGPVRVGFTVSRKVGNAVQRNRARRRLKAAAEQVLPRAGLPGHDYVVIGRLGTLSRPFALLVADLEQALARVHQPPRRSGGAPRRRRGKPSNPPAPGATQTRRPPASETQHPHVRRKP